MSDSGLVVHCRASAARTRRAVAELGVRSALLASNTRWTSVVALGDGSLDAGRLAVAIAASVVEVWFDRDSAVTVRFHGCDGWRAELHVATDGSYVFADQDARLIDELLIRGVLARRPASALARQLAMPASELPAWLRGHGIEAGLGVAQLAAMPVPCTESLARELARELVVVEPRAVAAPVVNEEVPASVAARSWTARETAIVDLHQYYLTLVWAMNDWKIYNLYKRHLPAGRRSEVDALVTASIEGSDDLRPRLEAILDAVWAAADWFAVIADPALDAETMDEVSDWRARIARVAAMTA